MLWSTLVATSSSSLSWSGKLLQLRTVGTSMPGHEGTKANRAKRHSYRLSEGDKVSLSARPGDHQVGLGGTASSFSVLLAAKRRGQRCRPGDEAGNRLWPASRHDVSCDAWVEQGTAQPPRLQPLPCRAPLAICVVTKPRLRS